MKKPKGILNFFLKQRKMKAEHTKSVGYSKTNMKSTEMEIYGNK